MDYEKLATVVKAQVDFDKDAQKRDLLCKIDRTLDRLASKDKAIEELQYVRGLILGDLLRTINEDINKSPLNLFAYFDSELLHNAWRWCHNKEAIDEEYENGKLSKEEYVALESSFAVATTIVKETFFGVMKDDVDFKEIIAAWTAGYDFTYTYKDQEITVFVPVFCAGEKDWEYVLHGYRVNYKESEITSNYVCSGLDYREVAKQLQAWLSAEGWRKED